MDRWLAGLKGTLFLSTLSLRRATPESSLYHGRNSNFYPRSPCGERRDIDLTEFNKAVFLSTLSLRRATLPSWELYQMLRISIHALLAESDLVFVHVCA